jgi:hypothetical protein
MFTPSVFLRIVTVVAVFVTAPVVILAQDKNLTAEEIIARHLASFGSADAIAKSVNRMAVGHADFTILSSQKNAAGNVVLASNGKDLALFSTFDMSDYRMERIGLFNNKVTVPVAEQGQRGPLGKFVLAYDKFVGQRLFGGSIFSTWALYSSDLNGVKVEVDGRKKVGGTDAWVLKVIPKGGLGSGSYIKLYFDVKDFHHIRTVYRQAETERGFYGNVNSKASGGGGQVPGSWDQDMASNGSTLTEDFSDFNVDAGGISLPHKYSVLLSFDSAQGSSEYKYEFKITEYKLIKEFPANFFSFQAQVQ